jgi:hypothetical protein
VCSDLQADINLFEHSSVDRRLSMSPVNLPKWRSRKGNWSLHSPNPDGVCRAQVEERTELLREFVNEVQR